MNATTKQTAVQVEFYYQNDVSEKDLRSIVKKVETFRKNCQYKTNSAFFMSRNEIQVVITFIDIDYKIYDNVRSPLNRLIDSHKQPATYGWNLDISDLITQKTFSNILAGKVSA